MIEYCIGYEWVNNRVTHGDHTESLRDARDSLAHAQKTFSASLLDAWIETRTVTTWKRVQNG